MAEKLVKKLDLVYGFLCALLAGFVLYTAIFGVLTAVIQRGLVLGATLVLTFLSLIKKDLKEKNKFTIISAIYAALVLISIAMTIYIVATFKLTVERAGAYTTMDIAVSIAVFVVMIIAAQRSLGWPMVIISLVFFAYTLFGRVSPGTFGHRGYSISRVMPYLSLGTEGIFGTSMGVAAGVIVTYSVFGAVMERFGIGDYFIKVAYGLVGRNKGGSAKASIVASGLMGTVSGSAVANILTTGSFTLPLMIQSGYSKRTAAAILAVAATGGLIMPPVMGAAAFVMSEMRGISYGSICIAAAVPAILYYLSLFVQSGLEADRIGMKVLTKDELPKKSEWVPKLYLFIPLAILLVLLVVYMMPAGRAACIAMLAILLLGFRSRDMWPTPKKLFECLKNGGSGVVSTILTCATAGIIVGCLSMTGLTVKISALIISLSGDSMFLSLVLTMIIALLLGMGMPPVAAYIILASMIVPSLVQMGIPQLAADMFCFYFACIGNITPPVALAAFTSAGLVNENPFKTGWLAFRYGLVTLLVPFAFCSNTALLLQGGILEIIRCCCTSALGVALFGVAMIGWCKGPVNVLFRVLLGCSTVLLIMPSGITDIIGVALFAIVFILIFISRKKNKAVAA